MRGLGKRDLLAVAGFGLISFLYFGVRLLPHPGRAIVGSGPDPLVFVWSFAWWPHAVGGWTDPFVTHALLAPTGANLLWATSVPGLALAFTPLTVLVGPVASYNVAAILLPAFGAWAAYRLCLHVSGSEWGSLVGGYLFGFSSFVLGHQLQGHLNLTAVFLLPFVVLVVIRFIEGGLSGRGFALRFGVLVALQFSISTELTLTLTLVLVLVLVVAFAGVPSARRRLGALVAPLLAGYGLAALLASPLVVYAALGFQRDAFTGAGSSTTDLLNLLVPTSVNAVAGSLFASVSGRFSTSESALYLGLPTLVIVVLYAWRSRRSPWARILVIGLVVGIVLALGATLEVDGTSVVGLPWSLVRSIPGLDDVSAPRFAVYPALAAAVIVALWAARTSGAWRYVLPLLAIAALVPAVGQASYVSTPGRVAFFADGSDQTCIAAGETLLVFPFEPDGDSMLWQAESGFRFRLAEGYLGPLVFGANPVFDFYADPTVYALDFLGYESLPTMDDLLGFAATHGIARVVTVVGSGYPSERQMGAFGSVEQIGGVLVSPACGQPPLTSRNLSSYVTAQQKEYDIGYCLHGNYYALSSELYPAGTLQGARHALLIDGKGLQCAIPAGFHHDGFAPTDLGVPANFYAYYRP